MNNEDFSPLYKENDYSWSDTKRFDENQNIAVYYKDSLIYGSEPDVTDDGDNSDWDISVYTRDARINRDNSIMPVIYIQNNDTRVLDDFEVYYLIKSEFGKIPEIANRHTPESDVSLESEDGDHYRVKYDYTGSYVIPGGDIPRGKGSVIEIKYPDNGDINKDNDYSWSGSRHLRENSRVLVYRNNELIYGIPPSPEDTITAKTHDAFSLKAVPVPVRRNGRISFYLISEKGIVDDINGEISIYNKVGDMVYSEEVDIVPVEHARRNNYFLKWDLKSGSGKGCIPGSYVVMLKLDGIEDTYQRMIYIGYR